MNRFRTFIKGMSGLKPQHAIRGTIHPTIDTVCQETKVPGLCPTIVVFCQFAYISTGLPFSENSKHRIRGLKKTTLKLRSSGCLKVVHSGRKPLICALSLDWSCQFQWVHRNKKSYRQIYASDLVYGQSIALIAHWFFIGGSASPLS